MQQNDRDSAVAGGLIHEKSYVTRARFKLLTNGKTRASAASGSANGSNRRDLCCSRRDYLACVCSDHSPPVRHVRRSTIRLCESRRLRRRFATTDLLGFYAHYS